MKQDPREYFRQREMVERAAAKRATSPEARRVHQELAQRYAETLGADATNDDGYVAPRSRLTIVTKLQ